MKQLSLIKTNHEFGGSLLVGKRKEARPIATKKPMHVIFKSEKARGIFALINHRRAIESAIGNISRRYRVKIFKLSVNNNHIHLVTQFKSREAFRAWVRVLSAEIVRTIARKTGQRIKNFFTQRPYTKIVNWGRHLSIALDYLVLNQMEYFGLRPHPKSRTGKVGEGGRPSFARMATEGQLPRTPDSQCASVRSSLYSGFSSPWWHM